MSRILVVEDEPEMARLLVLALTESGYTCESAPDGEQGLRASSRADLILADVMMPVMNGFAMVKELRARGCPTPVIFLTAKDQTRDVVEGLHTGGDDYLVKPFKLEELLARVNAALRRARDTSATLAWHDLELNRLKRSASRGGREIQLSSTEFALLELLMRREGTVLSKAAILRDVWRDDGYRDENIVELYVNYLRKKVEAHGGSRVIQTVRGHGYVLALAELEP